jgi:tetratricopeptide (TPR) repeat protein
MFEPISATWVITTSARLTAAGASAALSTALRRRTVRWRVAWSASKAAKERGIAISWLALRGWLARDDVQEQLKVGSATQVEACVTSLADSLASGSQDRDAGARVVLDMVLDEYLRKLPLSDAVAVGNRWTGEQIESSKMSLIRELRDDPAQLREDLGRLHPWRRSEAEAVAMRWPTLTGLVHTLVTAPGRGAVLRSWGESPPTQLIDAPAEAWTWLAVVAADYGERAAATTFMTAAIDHGASQANYLWARLGLIDAAEEGDPEQTRRLLERSVPPHPLASALLSMMEARYEDATQVLSAWTPDNSNDRAIRETLRVSCAVAQGDINRAIAIGLKASVEEPDSSGLMLRTAEVLLSRGQYGPSEDPPADFASALSLATRTRDSRRLWLGDSSAAILIAMKAAVLIHDVDRGWRLTQPPPDGEATQGEAADPRVRAESAVLAAMMGRHEVASAIAQEHGDEFVIATVQGFQSHANGDLVAAREAWMRAWNAAPDDAARAQTAAALAPLGGPMPDLSDFEASQPENARYLRMVHEVMSAGDERLTLLRARANESAQLTALLAEALADQGDSIGSAVALESGAQRWSDPLLMRMAAARYLHAGDYIKADEAARRAIALGGQGWAGELDSLMVRFEAVEGQGLQDESIAVARQMLRAAPDNLDARWAYIHCLARHGDLEKAWTALTYRGEPIRPRSGGDAGTWIHLLVQFDDSPLFFSRAMAEMHHWKDDDEVGGRFLIQIYLGLQRREVELREEDLADLHAATDEFTRDHPESASFRRIQMGPPDDPLAPFQDMLRAQVEDEALLDARRRVEAGEMPLGLLTALSGVSYGEVALRRAAGRVYSHSLLPRANLEASDASEALQSAVVLDPTAAVTLALLDSGIVDRLMGSFGAITTTDAAFRDLLAAQHGADLRSTMSVVWDAAANRPRPVEISEEAAERLAMHADRTVEILTRINRRGWPTLKKYAELPAASVWLSAADYAVTAGLPFWCDDRVLREMATSDGIQAFGTVDLLRALEARGDLDTTLLKASESILVHNYHVDLGFDHVVLRLAAQMGGWAPSGAAAALTRPSAWADPDATMGFALEAFDATSVKAPEHLRGWVSCAAIGLIGICADDPKSAATNLRALLERALAQSWMRPDVLPFVVGGIRDGISVAEKVEDPFAGVMQNTYRTLAARHGWAYAGELMLVLVQSLDADDRSTTARSILMTHP